MENFEHINAKSFEEAGKAVEGNKNFSKVVMAGGTDLMTVMRTRILNEMPETVVNLKTIEDGAYIRDEGDQIAIGAITKLKDVVSSEELSKSCVALNEAAHTVASPLIRNIGTIGGNICQDVRCWYYRYPEDGGGILNCARKGGSECYAIRGDNRYHSIYGGMKTKVTGCSLSCPVGTDIGSYMELLRNHDMQGACDILIGYNPLGAITGRICAHFCQDDCNRGHLAATEAPGEGDDSVGIHTVERCMGDYMFAHPERYYTAPEKETGKKVVLVGSGPAGLTAAYYLRKAGHDVTILDSQEKPGGMLRYAIPNYRLPLKYVDRIEELWKGMGVKFQCGVTVGKDVEAADLEKQYDKVFYATGAWSRPVLGFDGEEFTEFGLSFLVEVNQWMQKKERKHVLVIGGGNVAMDVAVTAKRLGAETVTLACLEARDEMPSSEEEIHRALEEGIKIMNSYGVSKALYADGKITGMELKRCVSVYDEDHHFSPEYDDTELLSIDADSVLMAAGQRVDLSFLKEEYDLAVERGRIKTDEVTRRTNRKDVYAGGDAVSGPSTVASAIRQGREAAKDINKTYGIDCPVYYEKKGFTKFDPDCLSIKHSVKDIETPVSERRIDKEDSDTVPEEAIFEEAKRCMNCACYSVNASDISPVLLMDDAEIVTTKKTINAKDFFTTELDTKDMLEPGELVKEIRVNKLDGYTTHYEKLRIRPSIDFAIISLTTAVKKAADKVDDIRLVLGGVAPVPIRLYQVEDYLKGKTMTADLIDQAVDMAVADCFVLRKNAYKVTQVKTYLKRFLESI
ncbi:FAD-dependent oxidoreductase [Ruminococcus sp. CLA-AA-H200]|uniref:FAD-dependent oxidoreductase n=1 Tax=Ruminococcus turbiniformis TaxID=2881258 RepID=A0ABS8G3I3_9FIRM|nr:FAD-dependent oxidoreductase [Ruminococcus turbiniformis]MCC2256138.1 FAD-dependent oxidoreductase [Ruminococcus turbiniformis]